MLDILYIIDIDCICVALYFSHQRIFFYYILKKPFKTGSDAEIVIPFAPELIDLALVLWYGYDFQCRLFSIAKMTSPYLINSSEAPMTYKPDVLQSGIYLSHIYLCYFHFLAALTSVFIYLGSKYRYYPLQASAHCRLFW